MNEDSPEYRYWKAAISQLPNHEMRDAAWKFFVRHLAQNPKMGDTFSGIILAIQAHGLYMLEIPRLIHNEALVTLGKEIARFRDELAKTTDRHAQITKDILAACEQTWRTSEATATSVARLRDIVKQVGRMWTLTNCRSDFASNSKNPSFVRFPNNAVNWKEPHPRSRKPPTNWRNRPANCVHIIQRHPRSDGSRLRCDHGRLFFLRLVETVSVL